MSYKKWFLSALLLAGMSMSIHAADQDSTVMTIAGKRIPLSEFLYIAQKNGEVNIQDKKSVKEYVELFKIFKLKVAQAESEGVDTTAAFRNELNVYHDQLLSGFLSDKDGEDAVVRSEYERGKDLVDLSYILYKLPQQTFAKDTASAYENAMRVYYRLHKGEKLETVGKELMASDKEHVVFENVRALQPLQVVKSFEDVAFTLPVGAISKPFRSPLGYHIMRVSGRSANEGTIQVAHILVLFKDSTEKAKAAALTKAQQVLDKIKAGGDFGELAKEYSDDSNSSKNGGLINPFNHGEMILPFEMAAFSLKQPGDVSGLVESKVGYHIIKLVARNPRPSFEDSEEALSEKMRQGDWGFEMNRSFDEAKKSEYGYKAYPDAFEELVAAADSCFPGSGTYESKVTNMNKPLFEIGGKTYSQKDFTSYVFRFPFSSKTYAGDFLKDVYSLYLHESCVSLEQANMKKNHPEFDLLMQEYRDGILLFDVSNREVWSKPAAEQKQAEEAWVKRLTEKYPVVVNWKLLDKLGN
mgnify:CR=1 FL=1